MLAEPVMQFDAVLRREHFDEFNVAFQKKFGNVNGGLLGGLATIVPVLVLMLAFAEWVEHAGVPRDTKATFGPVEIVMLAVLAGVLLTLLLSWLFVRRQMKAYKQGTLRDGGSFLGHRRITLDADGIRLDGAHGHSLTRWSVITEVTEAANTYLLWTDPGAAVMVPKEALSNDQTRTQFIGHVAAHTNGGSSGPPQSV